MVVFAMVITGSPVAVIVRYSLSSSTMSPVALQVTYREGLEVLANSWP